MGITGTTAKISIHALREEGDVIVNLIGKAGFHISIHALREEGDLRYDAEEGKENLFLSTPSARRATANLPIRSV